MKAPVLAHHQAVLPRTGKPRFCAAKPSIAPRTKDLLLPERELGIRDIADAEAASCDCAHASINSMAKGSPLLSETMATRRKIFINKIDRKLSSFSDAAREALFRAKKARHGWESHLHRSAIRPPGARALPQAEIRRAGRGNLARRAADGMAGLLGEDRAN